MKPAPRAALAGLALDFGVLRRIWAAWLLTIPYAAMWAGVCFVALQSVCKRLGV